MTSRLIVKCGVPLKEDGDAVQFRGMSILTISVQWLGLLTLGNRQYSMFYEHMSIYALDLSPPKSRIRHADLEIECVILSICNAHSTRPRNNAVST